MSHVKLRKIAVILYIMKTKKTIVTAENIKNFKKAKEYKNICLKTLDNVLVACYNKITMLEGVESYGKTKCFISTVYMG